MAHGDLTLTQELNVLKQLFLSMALKALQDLIDSGKINEFLKELVSKLIGVQGNVPDVVGCELKGDTIVLKCSNGAEIVLS